MHALVPCAENRGLVLDYVDALASKGCRASAYDVLGTTKITVLGLSQPVPHGWYDEWLLHGVFAWYCGIPGMAYSAAWRGTTNGMTDYFTRPYVMVSIVSWPRYLVAVGVHDRAGPVVYRELLIREVDRHIPSMGCCRSNVLNSTNSALNRTWYHAVRCAMWWLSRHAIWAIILKQMLFQLDVCRKAEYKKFKYQQRSLHI